MRQRIEDLGILAEKLETLLDHELFDAARMHDERFLQTYKDDDKLDELYHQIHYIKDELAECWHWARYGDTDSDESLKI